MSSRPLFVKRSRLSYRLLLWASPVLVIILAIAAWKAMRLEALVLWPPSADPSDVVVAANQNEQQAEAVGNRGQNMPPESPPAQAAAGSSSGAGQAMPLAQDSSADTEATTTALKTALDQWSGAWRAQDVPAYLGMYADDFVTPQGMSRRAWAQMRAARISGKQKIRHQIRDLQIDQQGLSATVKFTQIYADERTEASARKTMQWVFRDGRWLIAREATD